MKLKVKNVEWVKANARCKCNKCNHYIAKVIYDDGSEWVPTHSEITAINSIMSVVLAHNLANDHYCFKKEQIIAVEEVKKWINNPV